MKISIHRLINESPFSLSLRARGGDLVVCPKTFLLQEDSLTLFSELIRQTKVEQAQDLLVLFRLEEAESLRSFVEEKGSLALNMKFVLTEAPLLESLDEGLEKERFLRVLGKFDGLYCTPLRGEEFLCTWYKLWRDLMATCTVVHGTLISAYGLGVLLIGKSGIGKSEAAYALLRRGHRLVGDDAIRLVPSPYFKGALLGLPAEPSLQGFMEIKGVGIVSVIAMHGVGVLQDFTRVDLVIELLEKEAESSNSLYEALGLSIPKVYLEIKGHQDWTSLLESVILNSKLNLMFNYNALHECASSQEEVIKRKTEGL